MLRDLAMTIGFWLIAPEHERRRLGEAIALNLARRLPRWLTYWSVIHAWSQATTGPYGDQEAVGLTVETVLSRIAGQPVHLSTAFREPPPPVPDPPFPPLKQSVIDHWAHFGIPRVAVDRLEREAARHLASFPHDPWVGLPDIRRRLLEGIVGLERQEYQRGRIVDVATLYPSIREPTRPHGPDLDIRADATPIDAWRERWSSQQAAEGEREPSPSSEHAP